MWTLQAVRKGRSVRRRLFGKKLPHWAKDSAGFIKYLNFLRLLPTMHVMVCYPGHLFKSIPSILSGKKPYYVSPLQFVSNLAVLQIAVLALLLPEDDAIDKEFLIVGNLVTAAVSPILMMCACIAILVLWFLCISVWPVNRLTEGIEFNYHGALVPLSPSTYSALNWGRFFWSLLYYYLYFYLMFALVAGLFLGVEELILAAYASASSSGRTIYINKLTTIPLALVGLFAALAGYWLFVRPYILLLFHSSNRITKRMLLYLATENR
jgi:hypothetical protein